MTISDTFLGVPTGKSASQASTDVTVSVVRDRAEFAALRRDWDRLAAAVPDQPYADHAYLAAWLDSYGAARRPDIRIARQKGRLVAALPLCRGAALGIRTPVAQDRAGMVGPLLHPGLSAPDRILGALLRCRPGTCHVIEPVEQEVANLLWHGARRAGLAVEIRQVFTANSVDLSGGGDAWRAGLGKNARRSLARAAKALDGDGARWITSADGQVRAAAAFLRVAETSWKANAGTGFAGSPQGIDFVRKLAETADPATLYFAGLFHGETPVGGAFACVKGSTFYLNAVEFNEDMARSGPGRFVMCRMIETAAKMGLDRVDMMRTSRLNRSVAPDERGLFRVVLHRRGDPTVHLRKLGGLRRRLARVGVQGLSPRARHHAIAESGDET